MDTGTPVALRRGPGTAVDARDRAVWPVLVLLAIVLVFGGASRIDVPTHAVTRAAAIAMLGWCFVRAPRTDCRTNWTSLRVPLALMGLWTGLIALQSIPLPPAVWTALPGRAAFGEVLATLGNREVWRPLSLAPNATRNAAFAALVPLAVLAGLAGVRGRSWRLVLILLLALGAASALLGIVQISTQARAAYLYRITNEGAAVGLFANRNHQAVFLATCFPLLAGLLACGRRERASASELDTFILPVAAIALTLLILVTGSRAGLVAAALAIPGGFLIAPRTSAPRLLTRRRPALARAALVAGGMLLIGAAIALSRAEALERLFAHGTAQEARLRLLPVIAEIAARYLPWGTGFGSFDPVFRMHEPADNLSPVHLNHAHNDLIEVLIEGGLPAAMLVVAYLAWVLARARAAWRRPADLPMPREQILQRSGSVVIAILLLASLVDYPLRTPALATVLAVATAMLALPAPPTRVITSRCGGVPIGRRDAVV